MSLSFDSGNKSPTEAALRTDRSIYRLLLTFGIIDLLAFVATAMPIETMAWIHQFWGMGEMPQDRIVGYLARMASALYGFHGAILLFITTDIQRYLPLIRFLAWASLVHAVLLLAIDLGQRMPIFWTLLEAPGFALTGILMLWMLPPANGLGDSSPMR